MIEKNLMARSLNNDKYKVRTNNYHWYGTNGAERYQKENITCYSSICRT